MFLFSESFQSCWWTTSCSRGWLMERPTWTNLWSSIARRRPPFPSTTTHLQRRSQSGSEGRASVNREWQTAGRQTTAATLLSAICRQVEQRWLPDDELPSRSFSNFSWTDVVIMQSVYGWDVSPTLKSFASFCSSSPSERWHVWECWQGPSSSPSTRRNCELWFQKRAPEYTASSLCRKRCWRWVKGNVWLLCLVEVRTYCIFIPFLYHQDARRATELEAVMEKQKMKVDLKLESSTLWASGVRRLSRSVLSGDVMNELLNYSLYSP